MSDESVSKAILVQVDKVSLFLPGDKKRQNVLHDITWTIKTGEHTALLGQNASGKSTLLRLLAGELWPARGQIYWHSGKQIETSPIIGQAISALVSQNVQEQYLLHSWRISVLELLRSSGNKSQQTVLDLAQALDLTPLLQQELAGLSQGQLRLALLCRALLRKPRLLLLDECLEGLDSKHRDLFLTVLATYREQTTVIFTSHRVEDLPTWCRHYRYIQKGKLFLHKPPAPTISRKKLQPEEVALPGQGHFLFTLDNVTVFREREEVLHQLNWQMHQGEHWRISGANGSGKSTFLRLLAGDEFVAAGGTIERWLPKLHRPARSLEEIRQSIRLVSDLSQTFYAYAVNGLELVCSGFENSIGLYREYSSTEKEEALHQIHLLFAGAEAESVAQTSIRRLSTGQLRRLFLARALLGQPDILLLDEPCSGLDENSRILYLNLVDTLVDRRGSDCNRLHLIFVSHHAEDAPLCINREAQMRAGYLVADSSGKGV